MPFSTHDMTRVSDMDIELQSLIDTHEQPFVVIARSYRIVAANQRYCDAYGMMPAAIVGQQCHAVSHHSQRPCHENGEHCPHQALFTQGETVEVLHSHYHADNQPERTRIRGHRLRGADGELYLGEQLFPLEAEAGSECDAMQMIGQSPAFLSCVDNWHAWPKARPRSCYTARAASARNSPHASSMRVPAALARHSSSSIARPCRKACSRANSSATSAARFPAAAA